MDAACLEFSPSHGMRSEIDLRSRTGVRASFMALSLPQAAEQLDFAPFEKQARALNGNVQALQSKGQLVAHSLSSLLSVAFALDLAHREPISGESIKNHQAMCYTKQTGNSEYPS